MHIHSIQIYYLRTYTRPFSSVFIDYWDDWHKDALDIKWYLLSLTPTCTLQLAWHSFPETVITDSRFYSLLRKLKFEGSAKFRVVCLIPYLTAKQKETARWKDVFRSQLPYNPHPQTILLNWKQPQQKTSRRHGQQSAPTALLAKGNKLRRRQFSKSEKWIYPN